MAAYLLGILACAFGLGVIFGSELTAVACAISGTLTVAAAIVACGSRPEDAP
ncbi:hypothetical protein [Actinoplanes rectilineatus]|uniref:hypothetical protein n=1 Tax=Actinoplanes rectilineatus TaxID=113571 RepID=UPI000AEFFCF1|nr:hypothetical protein [Actinoplanes rectilineatus]